MRFQPIIVVRHVHKDDDHDDDHDDAVEDDSSQLSIRQGYRQTSKLGFDSATNRRLESILRSQRSSFRPIMNEKPWFTFYQIV